MIPLQEYFFHRKRCTPRPSLEFPAKRAKIVSPPDCQIPSFEPGKTRKKEQILTYLLYGAGDEARTRYLHLGKVALYQMSYARNGHGLL